MSDIFVEENGIYSIDCTNAVWATDKMHADYQKAGIHIKDVDFLIETDSHLIMVEYKNAHYLKVISEQFLSQITVNKINQWFFVDLISIMNIPFKSLA